MKIAALIPFKEIRHAKGRLAPVLGLPQRIALSRHLLAQTLTALKQSNQLDPIVLVSSEGRLAEELAVESLPDFGDINTSLSAAVKALRCRNVDAALVVPADLPYIDGASIAHFLMRGRDYSMTITRTQDNGTGALFVRPAEALNPHFGPDSFKRHVESAIERGLKWVEIEVPNLAFDLDTPDDFRRAQAAGAVPHLWTPAAFEIQNPTP